jgi:hypothetical protein
MGNGLRGACHAGKECKLQKKIGDELTKVIGGDAFSVDINKNLLELPRELPSALLPGTPPFLTLHCF